MSKKKAKQDEIVIFDEARFQKDLKGGTLCGFYNIPEKVYRPAPGVNWSTLKWMQQSEQTYKAVCDAEDEDSKDKQTGRIFHTMVLEPDSLGKYKTPEETYPATPKKKNDPVEQKPWNANAKYCRAWKAKQIDLGFEVVKQEQLDTATKMAEAINKIPYVQQAMADLVAAELVVFWTDHVTGLLCKCKIDGLRNDGEIFDLKSISIKGLGRVPQDELAAIIYYNQHYCQAAFYRDGVDKVLDMQDFPAEPEGRFTFFFVEKGKGHDTAIAGLTTTPDHAFVYPWIHCGREKYHGLLSEVAAAMECGIWSSWFPGPGGISEYYLMTIPEFLVKKLEVNKL